MVRQRAADQALGLGEIVAAIGDPEAHLAVIDEELVARLQRGEDLGMRQRRPRLVAGFVVEVEPEIGAGRESHPATGEIAEPELRALQIGEDADRSPGFGLDAADVGEERAVIVVRAVAEIAAEDVDPGIEQGAQPRRARTRRTQRRDDFGAALPPHRRVSASRPLSRLAEAERGWHESR